MRKSFLVGLALAAIFPAASALAAANCNIVNRELQLGKWPEDVALGMGITLAEVKECREQPAKVPPGQARKVAPAKDADPRKSADVKDR